MATAIHIALSFDDNFWAPAYALMRSICLSTTRRSDLVFHLMHMPLTDEHRADLERITDEFPARLMWHDLASNDVFSAFVADLPTSDRWPKVVYARLLIAQLLPQEVDRAIYLDCDMMVRWPVESLFEMDMDGKPLAAVQDSLATWVIGRRDIREKTDIFDTALPYFNSGMLLIDLEKWRSKDIQSELDELDANGTLARLYYDQDILNLLFRGNWHRLPWRWNVINAHYAHEAIDPAILHYTSFKPWAVLGGILHSTAFAQQYRHIMTNELFYRFARHRWKRWWLKKLPFRR